MKIKSVVMMCGLAGGLFLGNGCVERRVVYVGEPGPPASADAGVPSEPPQAQAEVAGDAPGPDYVWMPGIWEWRGHWIWIGGHWVVGPHPHALWVPGVWVHRRHGWFWVRGYWR